MATLVMPHLISSVPQALGPFQSGLMITFSLEFSLSISQCTMKTTKNGTWKLWLMEGNDKTKAESGIKDQTCQMVAPQNLMRMWPSPSGTYPRIPLTHLMKKGTHTLMPTSTSCQASLGSPGRNPKQPCSAPLSPILGLCGILKDVQSLYLH